MHARVLNVQKSFYVYEAMCVDSCACLFCTLKGGEAPKPLRFPFFFFLFPLNIRSALSLLWEAYSSPP